MIDFSKVPSLGAQRLSADPYFYAHGAANGESWFLLEFDGEDTALALIDEREGPIRLELISVSAVASKEADHGGFYWDTRAQPMPLSLLFPLLQQRLRPIPRPADEPLKPVQAKIEQSFAELLACNRWLER